jgi:hypothetical protein
MRALTLFAALTATLAATAQAAVLVTFKEPEKYVDTGRFRMETPQVLAELERHFQQLGTRYLRPDQTLRIEVLDVDLAGEERFRHSGQDVRILRGGADWPRMRLRYVLEGGDKPALSGEENLSDMNYLQRPVTIRGNENLAYEKRMLEEWFRAKFGPAVGAAGK